MGDRETPSIDPLPSCREGFQCLRGLAPAFFDCGEPAWVPRPPGPTPFVLRLTMGEARSKDPERLGERCPTADGSAGLGAPLRVHPSLANTTSLLGWDRIGP